MNSVDAELNQRLDALREQHLFRALQRVDSPQGPRIHIGGRTLLNFSSNDYLGLANSPVLKEAAVRALEKFGAGAGASRLTCGSLAPFFDLEETLADFKNTEAALSFSSGYATAIGTICALLGRNDIIVLDKLVHACMVDAARLSSAKIRVFAHNDLNSLEKILRWSSTFRLSGSALKRELQPPRTLIVTESIFSMDGDASPLREMVALKEKYGAWLMVDEAHATGIRGGNGRGLADELGLGGRIEIQMGTLGKALGASGGFVCGSRALIDFLVNHARSFIFSTAPVPAAAAAATAGIRLVQSETGEKLRQTLWQRMEQCRTDILPVSDLFQSGDKRDARPAPGAIIPVVLGDEAKAAAAAAALQDQGIFVPAIRYPTVARGKARLRVTLTAGHSANDVTELTRALKQILNRKSQIEN